jgi:hypothetical protein
MEVQIIDFPKIYDPRGNLTFIQNNDKVPFEIKRVFWMYDVPGGENRGGHAYYEQYEIIIALSGSFDVVLKDADGNTHKFSLNRSYYGLNIPPLTWRHMENFSTNAVGLHLSSMEYTESDYIREFDHYMEALRNVK